ncbi:MAG: hypothetical protein ACYCS1_09385 [Gammaproteobacteria bacterium]
MRVKVAGPLNIGSELGHVQHVHPDVVHIPGGFQGYQYWMVFNPYPRAQDRWENPVIRVSHDGYSWERFHNLPDPLVPAPADPDLHHADPELVYAAGKLHLVFMTARKSTGETEFFVMETRSGMDWSTPTAFHSGRWNACPTFIWTDPTWQMWMVELDTSRRYAQARIERYAGPDIFRMKIQAVCDMSIPGHVPWHLDVQKTDLGYEALVAAFPSGTDNSRTRLFHLVSANGSKFTLTGKCPLLAPSWLGWDNRMIYRSCFLKLETGQYRIWYSAASWCLRFGLGYLEGNIFRLKPSSLCPTTRARFSADLLPSLSMWLRYHARRRIPVRLRRSMSRLLTRP